jgi:glycosyltransferase involved in cell wall biosynthesis
MIGELPNENQDFPNNLICDSSQNLIILIVPCFNEEKRWNLEYWQTIGQISGLKLCFVNDGSKDRTSMGIKPLLVNSHHILLELPKNVGKAEAIRQGFNHILNERALGIGFLDADGAFPILDVETQIEKFRRLSESTLNPPSVWSSRVKLAGRFIERDLKRHYLARILVTLLAIRFKFTIYDTQCGLKIFPHSKSLESCMKAPFKTHWFVDLEIFLRWRTEIGSELIIWEEPLLGWNDVAGSKLSGRQYLTVLKDIQQLNAYMRKVR